MQLQLVKRVVTVASDAQLLNRHYRRRQWIAARNLNITRRKWPDKIAEALFDFDGDIVYPNGTPWPIPDIDDVMGNPRWMSTYLQECDGEPCCETPMIERLRMIDLYFRIAHPNIQRHFGR